ncbi:MAG: hypothetical protein ACJASU_002380 [Cognaticolwellia sp.]|jgi:hypothetical protein
MRIRTTIKLEKTFFSEALAVQQWATIDDHYQYRVNEVEHMDIKQRCIVVNSKAESHRRVVNDYDLIFIGLLNRATTYASEYGKSQ